MKIIPYIGNGAYCWPNSTAMMLASIGENISPSLIEVLGGVGLGAYALPDTNIAFFSNYSGLPDRGITNALKTLGFGFKEEAKESAEQAPFEELKEALKESTVVLGPLDMGYLTYNPGSEHLGGVDHYVLAYEINDSEIFVHDPAEFPHVSLSLEQLKLAWKADKISYKRGYYRYWASPKRIETPTDDEIYTRAIKFFQETYKTGQEYAKKKNKKIDSEAIQLLAENAEKELFTPSDIGMLTGFVFPLGAKRALDFATFFSLRNPKLSEIKAQQAKLFGKCHVLTMKKDWKSLSIALRQFAEIENKFSSVLFQL